MNEIRMGGVPEHFNLPWHLGMENGDFSENGVSISWRDFPDGTGAMCKALRENEIDGAVILTEGIVKDIIAGNQAKIVQEFIGTPLIWGIHVAANSECKELEDLENEKVAISRFGSGSHLMAYVNAKKQNWDTQSLGFETVVDIDGAINALERGKASYFMWEHFTTKPLVDQGIFRRLGDCPTPWPCFVIVFRVDFLQSNEDAVKKMLNSLNEITQDLKNSPGIETMLSERYQQKPEDIREWLKITEWSQIQISNAELERVQDQLYELNLIPEKKEVENFLHSFHDKD